MSHIDEELEKKIETEEQQKEGPMQPEQPEVQEEDG